MPASLSAAGARFITSDRHDYAQLAAAVGPGADLVVDAACYTAAHAGSLLPFLADVDSTVMLSSKAVYVDEVGNHLNSAVAPVFPAPIKETNHTMAPGTGTSHSREGYGANKVAAEQVFLDSGAPVSILRASKVHGAGAANPREWVFLKRILENRPAVFLAHGGRGADHTTAAAYTAALIEVVAANPGARILNSADPDAPTGFQIARVIANHMHHIWREVLLDQDGIPGLGDHPWNFATPIALDITASLDLGYLPVGSYAQTVRTEIDWLLASPVHLPSADDPYFAQFTDYTAEDEFLRAHPVTMPPTDPTGQDPLP